MRRAIALALGLLLASGIVAAVGGMILLPLLINGIVTGCALGVVAISFSLVYSTIKIFHVAHAGIYTLAGYIAWSLSTRGVPSPIAFAGAIAEFWGPAVGGLFLALPAIFCASATLIEKHERERKQKLGLAGQRRGQERLHWTPRAPYSAALALWCSH